MKFAQNNYLNIFSTISLKVYFHAIPPLNLNHPNFTKLD